jgi:predicted metal-binding protein
MKVGIIRCQQTGPATIVGFVSCGGCPGKRAVARAGLMVDRGAEAIAFASCISRGNPIGFPCPHFEAMRDAVRKRVGPDIRVIEWTH